MGETPEDDLVEQYVIDTTTRSFISDVESREFSFEEKVKELRRKRMGTDILVSEGSLLEFESDVVDF